LRNFDKDLLRDLVAVLLPPKNAPNIPLIMINDADYQPLVPHPALRNTRTIPIDRPELSPVDTKTREETVAGDGR
jgi:hypothetical protein